MIPKGVEKELLKFKTSKIASEKSRRDHLDEVTLVHPIVKLPGFKYRQEKINALNSFMIWFYLESRSQGQRVEKLLQGTGFNATICGIHITRINNSLLYEALC